MRPSIARRGDRLLVIGAILVTAGVLLHLPMYIGARDHGYRLVGMSWGVPMSVGMVLLVAGVAAVIAWLVGHLDAAPWRRAASLQTRALEDGALTGRHLRLAAVLVVAIAIDTLKPFTFTFILPGVAREYGLSSPAHAAPGHLPVALLPLAGIVGTVLGSVIWGGLADRVGRRVAILVAALIFVATSACGAMPSFAANLAMCFVMGLGAGGLLPIAYALLTETIPSRRRGQFVVLVAGVGTAAGFLLASGLGALLIPSLGWRVMWFVGLPTGLLLVALNRWIPESPRYLLARGRDAEAEAVMRDFGIAVVEGEAAPAGAAPAAGSAPAGAPPGRRLLVLTAVLCLYGLGWGLVNFGFIVWLPTSVARSGLGSAQVTGLLAEAALFSLPGSVIVAWLYGRWSARGTMVACAVLTAAVLGVFAVVGDGVGRHTTLLTGLVVLLLVAMWGVISVLAPYSAEVYPTRLRATGSGIVAGAAKLGGVLALGLSVAAIAPPSVAGSALFTLIPMVVAAAGLAAVGVETRGRRLDEFETAVATRGPALT